MNKKIKGYLKIARFDHWIKQAFIFPGIIFALFMERNISLENLLTYISPIILGTLATSLIASANYVINEWLDAEFDKYHPVKKNRPLLTANLKPFYIVIEYLLFLIIGLIVAFYISKPVFLMESWLAIMGIIYNVKPLRSKDIPYIDVLSESLNNAIRLLIGWFLISNTTLPPISIILGYWMGGAFLMAIKRFAEYRMIGDKKTASLYRKSFALYSEKALLISSFFYALLSIFFCGVFLIKYKIELLLSIPFICGLFALYLDMAYKPDSAVQKPEKLFHEKGLMLYLILLSLLVLMLLFVKIPILNIFLNRTLIEF
ncbi:MAG TPA: prenyltransferase [Alphaproteobacteria bacterium]|nr:prenyltransferase [Alphaproteobacteria bacterium]